MRKTLLILFFVLALGAVGFWVLYPSRSAEDEAVGPQKTTHQVRRETLRVVVPTTGRAVSNLDVEIKCKASGQVLELPFDISDPVKKGELLLRLDPVDEERALRQAEVALGASEARTKQAEIGLEVAQRTLGTERARAQAALESASARAEEARAKLERYTQLSERQLTSKEEFSAAQTASVQAAADLATARVRLAELEIEELALEVRRQDVALAKAQEELDRIQLDTATRRLEETKVLSPIDGVVASRDVQQGQIISSGISNVGGGTAVMVLSDLSRIFIVASVDESDIGRVALAKEAVITADAHPGVRFKGSVVRIATRGVNTSNVVTFDVKIEVVSKNKALLKPEMTSNVEILVAEHENVLTIPVEAADQTKDGAFVLIQRPGMQPERREVKLGMTDGRRHEILDGLAESDVVIVEGQAQSRWRNRPPGADMQRMMMMNRGRR